MKDMAGMKKFPSRFRKGFFHLHVPHDLHGRLLLKFRKFEVADVCSPLHVLHALHGGLFMVDYCLSFESLE